MGSTLRNDTARAVLLARLAKAWDLAPDLSLGELLARSLTEAQVENLSQLDNNEIAEAVERFALKRP